MSLSVVCGLHRSGTTFVGKLLQHASIAVVHEPLNERFGMVNVPIAYPYVEYCDDAYAGLIDDAVHLARPWNKNMTFIRARGLKRLAYGLTGGRSGLRWGCLRMRQAVGMRHPRICLKDPFMSFATPWLVCRHGLRVLCLVRHPAAIYYSTEKHNWRFDAENLLRQPALITRYGADIPEAQWKLARKHSAASIAVLWKLMVRINSRLAQSDERLKMITHESLCLEPVATASHICNHFGITFSLALERFVIEHSGGDRAEAKDGRMHDFMRDSRAIPDAWRGKLTPNEEQVIFDIAGDETLQVYGRL